MKQVLALLAGFALALSSVTIESKAGSLKGGGSAIAGPGPGGGAIVMGNPSCTPSTTSATCSWNTTGPPSVPSDTTLNYGLSAPAYGLTVTNPALVTAHSINATGLAAGTTYFYQMLSAASGWATGVQTGSFTTLGVNISSVNVSPGSTTATVTWTTNVAADSNVGYDSSANTGSNHPPYGITASDATLVTSHSMVLSGLVAGVTYHYGVTSTGSGSTATTSDATFTTSAPSSVSCPYVALAPMGANDDGCRPLIGQTTLQPKFPNFFNNGTSPGTAAQSGQSYIQGTYTASLSGTTLTIPSGPNISECVTNHCTVADDSGDVTKGTYIVSAIDSTHWTVSNSQATIAPESIALVRRPWWNACEVEFPCRNLTDFDAIIASGNATNIDAINPYINTPAGCSIKPNYNWNNAINYLSCNNASPITLQTLYMGPIPAYGARAAHGCLPLVFEGTGATSSTQPIVFNDVEFVADTTCTTNLNHNGNITMMFVYMPNPFNSPITGSHVSMYANGAKTDQGGCCYQFNYQYTMANMGSSGATDWEYFYVEHSAGQYNFGKTATTSTVVQKYHFYNVNGFFTPQGHMETQTMGPYLAAQISYSGYVMDKYTMTHQSAWRGYGSGGGDAGSFMFDHNFLAWNVLAAGFNKGQGFSGVNLSYHYDGTNGYVQLDADLPASCGSPAVTPCKLSGQIGLGNYDTYLSTPLTGDGIHAGSQWRYDCGVASAAPTQACPQAGSSNGTYNAKPCADANWVPATFPSGSCTGMVFGDMSPVTNQSVSTTSTNYTGYETAGSRAGTIAGSTQINCNGVNTYFCVLDNFVDNTGSAGFYWHSPPLCNGALAAGSLAGNVEMKTGVSINTFDAYVAGSGC